MKDRIILLILCMALPLAALAGPGREALERFTSELETLDARFEQSVLDTDQGSAALFYGVFQMKRPNRFRWDYVSPEERHIIADGRDLWIVEPDLNHITQYYQSMALKGSPATLLLADGPLEDQFKVIELGERVGLQWLELLPHDPDSKILRVLVAFKGADLTRLELTDQFGQISRFSFFEIKRNVPLSDKQFEYEPPDDWDILKDLRG